MARTGVEDFIAAATADDGLRAECRAATSPAELAAVARRHGYELGEAALWTAVEQPFGAPGEGELLDSELESVAGGLGPAFKKTTRKKAARKKALY